MSNYFSILSATDVGELALAGLTKMLPDDGSEFSTFVSKYVLAGPDTYVLDLTVTNTETGGQVGYQLVISRKTTST